MIITCLLISDDPDDQIEFSEALDEVLAETVLITVSGVRKAIDLLLLKRCVPDYIFLNVGIADLELERFIAALNSDPVLMGIQVVPFGEDLKFDSPRIVSGLGSNLSFSQLKEALRGVISKKKERG